MASNDGSHFIADHVTDLPRSGIRDFFEVVSQTPNAISLGIGEPDFVTPWHIREAAILAIEQGKTSYTHNLGLLELRKAVTTYVTNHFCVEYNPEDEVLISVGVSEAIDIALRAFLNPGDKVLYHEPCYVSYSPSVTLAHAKAISVPTFAKEAFTLDADAIMKAWEPGCRILILNFPTNPTGGVMGKEDLERVAKFAIDKDLLVISDEIYSELTYENDHFSITSLPGMRDRTILLHGVSKAFAMTGFRLGFACGPAPLIEAMMKIHQYCMMCASIISQEAAIEALTNGHDSVQRMKEEYCRRRDYIVRRFNEMGLPCHKPKGSFYAFPDIRSTGMDEKTFAKTLLHEAEVAVVPGSAFGGNGQGFVRAGFATSYERILEATQRIQSFIESKASLTNSNF